MPSVSTTEGLWGPLADSKWPAGNWDRPRKLHTRQSRFENPIAASISVAVPSSTSCPSQHCVRFSHCGSNSATAAPISLARALLAVASQALHRLCGHSARHSPSQSECAYSRAQCALTAQLRPGTHRPTLPASHLHLPAHCSSRVVSS